MHKSNEDVLLLNPEQDRLYKLAMKGVSALPEKAQRELSDKELKEIYRKHRSTQRILNLWKQKVCIKKTNDIFEKLFPNSNFTQALVTRHNKTDVGYYNTMSLRDLGITKPMIIDRLIRNKVLPKDFYKLKDERKKVRQLSKV
jgi:hypothetical protein